MILIVAIAALASLLATTGHAHAEPVSALIAIIGGIIKAGGIGALIIKTLISVGISLGLGLLKRALSPRRDTPQGVTFEVQLGDDHAVATIIGDYATGGKRVYIGTWGKVGNTPNAYLVDVLQVGDLPAPRVEGFDLKIWLTGKPCTILWDEDPTEMGYPVEEFREDGKDHLWVTYRDGTDDEASAYLLDKFGADPDRPWLADMVGVGTPILIVTALVNRELFPGQVQVLCQPPAIPLYDIRKDSTAGGSGAHRWGDPATWEPSRNNMVAIYNIVRGLYFGLPGVGEWVYGGQNLPAFRQPASSWMAAMNACDVEIDIDDGPGGSGPTTEPAFRCGMEIRGDMEPLTVIEELLKGCSGRLAEVGGIFKPLVGLPGTGVYAFTDAEVLVSKPQQFQPFPQLEETYNAINATYPEPLEAWGTKDAPELVDAALVAEDDGRTLPIAVTFPATPFGMQVERLMRTMLLDGRRFRVHVFHLPPEAWLLEPNDVVVWTSARNGYNAKLFVVEEITGERSVIQQVVLREVDPDDYDWDVEYEFPIPIAPVGPVRPPAQVIVDWYAEGVSIDGDNGARRAGIKLGWDGEVADVVGVEWEVRRASDLEVVLTGRTERVEAGQAYISGNLFSATDYQARGRYIPGTNRRTLFSDWLAVTTPDIPQTDVAVELRKLQEDIREEFIRRQEEHEQTTRDLLRVVADIATRNMDDVVERRMVEQQVQTAYARISEERRLRVSADEAFAENLIVVEAGLTDQQQQIAAQALAFQGLSTTVTMQGTTITALSNAITAANAQIAGINGTILGQGTAINQLQASVTSINGQITAISESLTAVIANSNNGTASGLIRWRAVSAPSGVSTRFAIEGRATSGATYRFAGAWLDVLPASSRWVFIADQFVVSNGAANSYPFVFQDGVLTANQLRVNWASISAAVIANLRVNSAMIEDLTITRIKLAPGAATDQVQRTAAMTTLPGAGKPLYPAWPNWGVVASVTINNQSGRSPIIIINGTSVAFSTGDYSVTHEVRLVRADNPGVHLMTPISHNFSTINLVGSYGDANPPVGVSQYQVQARARITAVGPTGSAEANINVQLTVLLNQI